MDNLDLLAADNLELVQFNALQPDPKRVSIGSTVRNIAHEMVTWAGYVIHNNDSSLNTWVQIFFKPSNMVTLGSTPPDFTIKLTPGASVAWDFYRPIRQGSGMSVASTTTETGSTAPATLTTGQFLIKKKPRQTTPS